MDPQDINSVLQKRDIDDLKREIAEGFRGVHNRQDEANHQTAKNTMAITELEKINIKRTVERKYEKLIWWLCTSAIGAVVALASYILYHKSS